MHKLNRILSRKCGMTICILTDTIRLISLRIFRDCSFLTPVRRITLAYLYRDIYKSVSQTYSRKYPMQYIYVRTFRVNNFVNIFVTIRYY